eukprot:SAG31_NODE_2051_length_6559_cov_370.073684_3_plen_98_part_00
MFVDLFRDLSCRPACIFVLIEMITDVSAKSLRDFLAENALDFATYMPFLHELGATTIEDLAFVESSDIRELNIKAIPRNKLLAALATVKKDLHRDEL